MPIGRNNIRLDEAVDRYLQRLDSAGYSESSRRTTKYTLQRFHRAVGSSKEPDPYVHTLTADTLDHYLFGPGGIRQGGHSGRPISADSFNRYRTILKVFFDYCTMMRWTDVNPLLAIDAARPDAPKKRLMLSASELLALPEYCATPLERIAVAIGENTGLRGNDVRRLTVFDISLATGTIQTEIRKTKRLDEKPISLELRQELDSWLQIYRTLMQVDELPDHWLLIPSFRRLPFKDGDRLHLLPEELCATPWRLIQRPLARMGYPTKGEGFHTLRRSAARVLFDNLRDRGEARDHALMIVKEFLNHASVSQTEHYLGLNFDRVVRDALLKDQSFLGAAAAREQARLNPNIETLESARGA